MTKLITVEDYIEAINGERDLVTGKLKGGWANEPILSLARYDVDVIRRMCEQCMEGTALTERQAQLALKIILNYERQLTKKGIDITPMKTPTYRRPLRTLDYTCKLYIDNGKLHLKFPYNQKLIDSLRAFGKESQGRSAWNPETKVWSVALTEYNLNWCAAFAEIHKFNIDEEVQSLIAQLLDVESTDYKIELAVRNGQLELLNAAPGLLAYIDEHLGGVNCDNLIKLVDYSSILGYTVEPDLISVLSNEYGNKFITLATNRELKVDPNTSLVNNSLEEIFNYAEQSNRLPVYIYEPNLAYTMLNKIRTMFKPEEILEVKHSAAFAAMTDDVKVVYLTKPMNRTIPLLISTAGMIYGGEKEVMVQNAEKIVYCAAEVYNKKTTKGIKSLASTPSN